MTNAKPRAALLASPGMGHLIPVLELGKRMVTHHDFHVTLFVVESSPHASNSLLLELPNNLDIVELHVDLGLIDPNANIVEKLLMMVRESLPSLRSSITAMEFRPTALVVDLFGTDAFPIADEFGMLKYTYNTSTAWYLAFKFYSSSIDKKIILEDHVKGQKPLKIPGCKTLRWEDIPESLSNIDMLDGFRIMGIVLTKIDGILVNSWDDLESTTIEVLRVNNCLGNNVGKVVPVYPVGPLVRADHGEHVIDEIKVWLDKQPTQSVIYVSFGSGGTLPAEQIIELAWGLEQSQQKFIWVVRPPSENAVNDTYFTAGEKNGTDITPDYLPEGFLTRTKTFGLVIPMWAPQGQILSHPSVGGFLSHCGWNSTLESISNGVPMIAWPLYAEQKMNAAMLTEDFGIAIRPNVSTKEGIVGRFEIEKLVRKIMVDKEGIAMRKKVKELKVSAEKALSKGGSSYKSLSLVAEDCLNRLHS